MSWNEWRALCSDGFQQVLQDVEIYALYGPNSHGGHLEVIVHLQIDQHIVCQSAESWVCSAAAGLQRVLQDVELCALPGPLPNGGHHSCVHGQPSQKAPQEGDCISRPARQDWGSCATHSIR